MDIRIKRIYDEGFPQDGFRVLVDRIWPRGVCKDDADLDEWDKDLAPSTDLRTWFGHDPQKFAEFTDRYRAELDASDAPSAFLAAHRDRKRITLVYAAKDAEHNHALVLRDVLAELA